MPTNFPLPPQVGGSVEKQVLAIRSYLYRMAEQLNTAVNNISPSTVQAIATAMPASGGQTISEKEAVAFDSLRSIIIQNAKFAQAEIDRLDATLESNYVVQSDFGTYKDSVTNAIKLSADGLTQKFDYSATIDAINAGVVEANAYFKQTSGYIKIGIVDYDPVTGKPQYGIGIGQDVTVEDENLIMAGFSTLYTANKLSFYQGATEIFYIKDSMLYGNEIKITGKFAQGNWQVDTGNGWTLRWIGA